MQKVFTPQSVGDRKENLNAIQIGGTWLYSDDLRAISEFLDAKSKLIVSVLESSGVSRFSYIAAVGRKALSLEGGDYELVRVVLNYTCAKGNAFKLLCKGDNEAIYACYFAKGSFAKVGEVVESVLRRVNAGGVVRFKELAALHFGGVAGSFYWGKGVAEHLAYLGLVRLNDKWSVRSN